MNQAEYERRRRVWRYLTTGHAPIEPPQEGDEAWLKSAWEKRDDD